MVDDALYKSTFRLLTYLLSYSSVIYYHLSTIKDKTGQNLYL